MGLFRRKHSEPEVDEREETVECPHIALSPRWENPEDMGHEDRATNFICQACGSSLTPEQARAVHVV